MLGVLLGLGKPPYSIVGQVDYSDLENLVDLIKVRGKLYLLTET